MTTARTAEGGGGRQLASVPHAAQGRAECIARGALGACSAFTSCVAVWQAAVGGVRGGPGAGCRCSASICFTDVSRVRWEGQDRVENQPPPPHWRAPRRQCALRYAAYRHTAAWGSQQGVTSSYPKESERGCLHRQSGPLGFSGSKACAAGRGQSLNATAGCCCCGAGSARARVRPAWPNWSTIEDVGATGSQVDGWTQGGRGVAQAPATAVFQATGPGGGGT